MDKIQWTTPTGATKHSLEFGIQQWVKQRTGLEYVYLSTLYRTNLDDLMLIAVAMGYKPNGSEQQTINWLQASAAKKAAGAKDRLAAVGAHIADVPHDFRSVVGGRFCGVCGAIKASRLHDPVTSEGGIALSPFPQSHALIAAAIEEIESEIAHDAGASDSGLDADYEEKGGPF